MGNFLAKRHKVVAIDINSERIKAARENAKLFGVNNRIVFLEVDGGDSRAIQELGEFDAIYIDVDWREDLTDPIKKQNLDPFKTIPATDKLYKMLRKMHPNVPIVFKVSPHVRVKNLTELDPCTIEELYIDNKFLSYNVYYWPNEQNSAWQAIHLSSDDKINQ